MSWNNKAETEKWKKDQKQKRELYFAANMPTENIQKIEEYDLSEFRRERRFHEHLDVTYPFDEEVFHRELCQTDSNSEIYDENNPYGFRNEVLKKLWETGDEIDRNLLYLLMRGCTEIKDLSIRLKISEKTIGNRILQYKNSLKK